jgi:probable H4MPT-linked C1 transfer pathway protein
MFRDATGLDIGGANLKITTAGGTALTRPFALWKNPECLARELASLRDELVVGGRLGVTMTGELCDCFLTKRDGVRHILAAVAEVFPTDACRFWSTEGRYQSLEEAGRSTESVAAANWHALATFAGRFAPAGPALLVDTGSTTTDIIPLKNGRPIAVGKTDPERMRSGELIYTGASRTPVCAVLGSAVAAEWFATTRDVYLALGLTDENPDDLDTCDSRPATREFAHGRLARLLGGDTETISREETHELAQRAFAAQSGMIGDGIRKAVARLGGSPSSVVLSGSGEFLARASVLEALPNLPGSSLISFRERFGAPVASAACAYALAVLAGEERP